MKTKLLFAAVAVALFVMTVLLPMWARAAEEDVLLFKNDPLQFYGTKNRDAVVIGNQYWSTNRDGSRTNGFFFHPAPQWADLDTPPVLELPKDDPAYIDGRQDIRRAIACPNPWSCN